MFLEKSSNSFEWQEIGKVELKNIQEKDVIEGAETTCLNTADKNFVYLLMGCTNQVYQFNYQTLLLERIDKTYYGGFNCRSTKFIRNKTIYSVGGYGLYRTNNLFVYYQANRNEWDAINFLNDAPKSIIIHTKKGSHLGFFSNYNLQSWYLQIVTEFLKLVNDNE